MENRNTSLHPVPRRRLIFRTLQLLLLVTGVFLGLLASCQSKLIYFPRPYGHGTTAEWQQRTAGKRIDFQTSQDEERDHEDIGLISPIGPIIRQSCSGGSPRPTTVRGVRAACCRCGVVPACWRGWT